jgi:hypothetical protein
MIALIGLSVWAFVACSSTTTAPRTDDEKITALYGELRHVLSARDQDRFLELACPQLRTKIEPEDWFKDADKMGKISSIVSLSQPEGDGAASPDVTSWRQVNIEPEGGGIQVAKISDDWFLCET